MLVVGINAAPLAAARTGVGRYIAGLLDALARCAPPDLRLRPLFAPGAPARGLRPFLKTLPGAYALAEAIRAAVLERQRSRGLTLYHETNHAAPRFEGPVVLTVHDLSTVLHPDTQEKARARHFAQALRKRARLARRVIVPTQAIAREAAEHLGVDRARLRVIHHGVGPQFCPGGMPRDDFLLYVGALDPRKGLGTLLDALPPEVDLLLAGPADRTAPEVRRRLGGRVRALGYVPDDQLLSLYRKAAAFVLPSSYEGFGLPLLEALACGTPCIASDDPALVEVAGGAALHFPRGAAAALRAQIARLRGDPSLRDELSRKGVERARAFSWDACARAHIAAYREAAG